MIVALTTDFGEADGYVGAMKGVILDLAPAATVVDITHGVPPFDIAHGAFALSQAAPYFPAGTVHVVVIDPGVGGERRALAVYSGGQYFVAPDNGVLTPFLAAGVIVRELTNPAWRLANVSATFHGRDVFAPAAARLAAGADFLSSGPAFADPIRLAAWDFAVADDGLHGAIVHIDRFGNCITSVPAMNLASLGAGPFAAVLPNLPPIPLRRSYSDVAPGEPLCLAGSSGLLEIAVRDGHAARALRLQRGESVQLQRKK
jgi:S-adenosylmethionine hydrolase